MKKNQEEHIYLIPHIKSINESGCKLSTLTLLNSSFIHRGKSNSVHYKHDCQSASTFLEINSRDVKDIEHCKF